MSCDLVPCRMSTPLWVIVMRMLRPAEPQADRSIIPNSEPIGRLESAKASATIPNDFFSLHKKNGHG
jgi:hypothetical protein